MTSNLEEWLSHPESMTTEAAQKLPELIAQYPYCAVYRLMYVIALGNVHSTKMVEELRRTAVWMTDRTKLFSMVNNGEYEWLNLMMQIARQQQQPNRAVDNDFLLIDRYLEQAHLPEVVSSGYSVESLGDMAAVINDDDDEVSLQTTGYDEQDALIDSFIQAEHDGALFVPATVESDDASDDVLTIENIKEKAFLTESLAKVYIKQHKYEQALAIIRELNLKYPKKNSYFADQIRFLETILAYKQNKNN